MYRRNPVLTDWTMPTRRIRSIQVLAALQSFGVTPRSIAMPVSAGIATRATVHTTPAAMPRYISRRYGRTAERMRRQPALRFARSSEVSIAIAVQASPGEGEATSVGLTRMSGFRAALREQLAHHLGQRVTSVFGPDVTQEHRDARPANRV